MEAAKREARDDNGLTATGKFIIDVSNTFTEQTIHQFVKLFNSSSTSLKERIFDSFLLNGLLYSLQEVSLPVQAHVGRCLKYQSKKPMFLQTHPAGSTGPT